MSSTIGSKRNVKIFVLYLMKNIKYPLDYITLNEIIMQTDYVIYLDFAESFHEMLDAGLIESVAKNENAEDLYYVTPKGDMIAEQLRSDILSSILDKCLAAALRYLDFKKRGVSTKCSYSKRLDGQYDFVCSIFEKNETIYSTNIVLDSENRAARMKEYFDNNPENIYRGVLALLSGEVNYIFDN